MNTQRIAATGIRISLVLALGLLGGCAYRLGSMLPPDIKNVHVPTFINKTDQPLLEVACTQAAIREIQKDGSLRVSARANADAILEVTLLRVDLSGVDYAASRPTATTQYRETIVASFVMKRVKNDTVVVESPAVIGETVFSVSGDLFSSKSQAIPKAAQDLARRIVNAMVQAW